MGINRLIRRTGIGIQLLGAGVNWILSSGFWNDSKIWDDTKTWID